MQKLEEVARQEIKTSEDYMLVCSSLMAVTRNMYLEGLGPMDTVQMFEAVADSIIATLGINPQSRMYASTREYLVQELVEGDIANGLEQRISEFVCSIDIGDIFGSFRRAVFGGGGGQSQSALSQLVPAGPSME